MMLGSDALGALVHADYAVVARVRMLVIQNSEAGAIVENAKAQLIFRREERDLDGCGA